MSEHFGLTMSPSGETGTLPVRLLAAGLDSSDPAACDAVARSTPRQDAPPRIARPLVLAFRVHADRWITDIRALERAGRGPSMGTRETLERIGRIPELGDRRDGDLLELEVPVTYRLRPA